MQWSHNDNWMVTADHFGYIKYWQSNMNNVKMYQGHKEPIRGLRYHHLHMDFLNSRFHDKSVHLFVCGFVSNGAAGFSSSNELDPSEPVLSEATRNMTMWVFPVVWMLPVIFLSLTHKLRCFVSVLMDILLVLYLMNQADSPDFIQEKSTYFDSCLILRYQM
jgi:hypothetical protein